MAWTVFGQPFTTSEITDTSMSQPVVFTRNIVLRAVRTWLIFYNDPVLSGSIQMKIYSNNAGLPGTLLHTSTNSLTKAEMITLQNGVKEVFFEFNYPVFQANDTYHLVINGTGYTGTTASHIAWMQGFPDPVLSDGYTPMLETLMIAPYQVYFIGADL